MRFLMNENLCSKLQIDKMDEDRLLACLLSLNELESTVLFYLFSHPGSTTKEIAQAVDRHRSTVQKALEQLLSQGLTLRKANSLSRGYAYAYAAISKKELKKSIVEDVKEWCKIIEEKLIA
ncbi:MAG: MarR family transcriptional regulator [Theionarchaea archaeon]|nr:MarR family transcriptional regulator [Theionarchaea archaeon]